MNLVLLMNLCISPMLQYSEISGFGPNALKHLNLNMTPMGSRTMHLATQSEVHQSVQRYDTHRLKV